MSIYTHIYTHLCIFICWVNYDMSQPRYEIRRLQQIPAECQRGEISRLAKCLRSAHKTPVHSAQQICVSPSPYKHNRRRPKAAACYHYTQMVMPKSAVRSVHAFCGHCAGILQVRRFRGDGVLQGFAAGGESHIGVGSYRS